MTVRSLQLDQVNAQWIVEVQRLVSSIAYDDYDGFSLFIRTVAVPLLKAMTPQNSVVVFPILVSFVQHVSNALTQSWVSVIASRGPDSFNEDSDDDDDDDTDADINEDSERRILSGNVAALINSIVQNSLASGNASGNEALAKCACDGLFWYDSRVVHNINEALFSLVTRFHGPNSLQVLSGVFQNIATHALQRGSAPSLLPSWPDPNLVKTTLFVYQTLMSASPAEFRAYLVSSQCVSSVDAIDVCIHPSPVITCVFHCLVCDRNLKLD